MRKLLVFLLTMVMGAPAFAFDPYKGVQEEVDSARIWVKMIQTGNLSTEEKFTAISENFVGEVNRRKLAENFIEWYMEGIGRALDAAPLKLRDSLPPDMENADIPEYLVKQLMNFEAMKRVQDEVVGAKPTSPVLYVGIKLTEDEHRRLSSRDDMINFILNHEDRLFYQLEK